MDAAQSSGIDGRWRQRIPTAEYEYEYEHDHEGEPVPITDYSSYSSRRFCYSPAFSV